MGLALGGLFIVTFLVLLPAAATCFGGMTAVLTVRLIVLVFGAIGAVLMLPLHWAGGTTSRSFQVFAKMTGFRTLGVERALVLPFLSGQVNADCPPGKHISYRPSYGFQRCKNEWRGVKCGL